MTDDPLNVNPVVTGGEEPVVPLRPEAGGRERVKVVDGLVAPHLLPPPPQPGLSRHVSNDPRHGAPPSAAGFETSTEFDFLFCCCIAIAVHCATSQ